MKRTIVCAAAAAALTAGYAAADVIVYNGPNFTGAELALPGDAPNLEGTGFYDTIASIHVRSGRWRFCSRPELRGDCEVLGPGRYATLPRSLNHRIESVQRVDNVASGPGVGHDREGPRGWPRAAIEIYAGQDFTGPRARLDRDVWSLQRRGMDDRVSSLVVNEGRWELCTQRGYEGFCRVFGPGEYPRLGRRMEEQVSSMRRVG